jgi:hypothetical protein
MGTPNPFQMDVRTLNEEKNVESFLDTASPFSDDTGKQCFQDKIGELGQWEWVLSFGYGEREREREREIMVLGVIEREW